MKINKASIFSLAMALALATGCSSSGGGSTTGPGECRSDGIGHIAGCIEYRPPIEAAAAATPRHGSVIQSSDTDDSSDPTTTSIVTVGVAYNGDAANSLDFDISLDFDARTITLDSDSLVPSLDQTVSLSVPTTITTVTDPVTIRAAAFVSDLGEGKLYSYVFTDHSGVTGATVDLDYLAAGFWAFEPESGNNFHVGAFIDTPQEYPQTSLAALAGTVSYTGVAVALLQDQEEIFDGEVRLTVDFGDGTELGTIEGGVAQEPDGNFIIIFNSADIEDTEGGFFTGTIGYDYDGNSDDEIGKWGGVFVGAGGPDPEKVAGTFAGADGTNFRFIGTYIAFDPTRAP